jgi:hypothetical protein
MMGSILDPADAMTLALALALALACRLSLLVDF